MNCRKCNSKMILRKPTKPNQNFEPFWGCSKFPECNGTRRYQTDIDHSTMINTDFVSVDAGSNYILETIKKKRKSAVKKVSSIIKKNKVLNKKIKDFSVKEFPYLSFPYSSFNILQRKALPYVDRDCNIIVCSPTSSGKTSIAEMVIARTLYEKNVAIYLCPLRALASQKYYRWTHPSHEFSKKNVTLHTGDVSSDLEKKALLNKSDIIIQTSEMLHHKSIHPGNKNAYLFKIGCVIVDEAHLIAEPSRGSELECGLERFTSVNSNARIVFLSATMENEEELKNWLTNLNGKPTKIIKTNYRPCKLYKHYEKVDFHHRNYDYNRRVKAEAAIEKVLEFESDKFILFVQAKSTGYKLLDMLKEEGIESVFHSRDLNRTQREEAEQRFEHGDLRVIVATSTLAIGLDLPARRVCILGTKRGPEKVSAFDINQMLGRAGRPSFDKQGDAYIFIDKQIFDKEKERIEAPLVVKSQLGEESNFLFHVLMAIYSGHNSQQKIIEWFKRTLCYLQNTNPLNQLGDVIDYLKFSGFIEENNEGEYIVKNQGKICCWFYMSPLDIKNWIDYFNIIHRDNNWKNDFVIWALSAADKYKKENINKYQSEAVVSTGYFKRIVEYLEYSTEGQLKNAAALYCLTNDKEIPKSLYSCVRDWRADIGRVVQALKTVDKMVTKWNKQLIFERLVLSIEKGISLEKAELASISGIGKKRVDKLFSNGIYSVKDLLKNIKKAKQLLGPKVGHKAVEQARKMLVRG